MKVGTATPNEVVLENSAVVTAEPPRVVLKEEEGGWKGGRELGVGCCFGGGLM